MLTRTGFEDGGGLTRPQTHRLATALLLFVGAIAVFGCGGIDTGSGEPEASLSSATTGTSSPPAAPPESTSTTAPPQVLEPQFGETTRPQPGTVTLSDAAKAFEPPATMPLYRIVATPITNTAMKELADRLGMATDRRYSFDQSPGLRAWIDDGEWNLMFFCNDRIASI